MMIFPKHFEPTMIALSEQSASEGKRLYRRLSDALITATYGGRVMVNTHIARVLDGEVQWAYGHRDMNPVYDEYDMVPDNLWYASFANLIFGADDCYYRSENLIFAHRIAEELEY